VHLHVVLSRIPGVCVELLVVQDLKVMCFSLFGFTFKNSTLYYSSTSAW
jgi:hypothetical protein